MTTTINASTTSGLVNTADTSGILQFQTNSGITAMTIDTSQNVGIGTSSPDNKLEVALTDNAGINLEQLGASQTGYINWRDSDGTLSGRISYDHGTDAMRFATVNTERMRIDSSGNVGIGTTLSGTIANLNVYEIGRAHV